MKTLYTILITAFSFFALVSCSSNDGSYFELTSNMIDSIRVANRAIIDYYKANPANTEYLGYLWNRKDMFERSYQLSLQRVINARERQILQSRYDSTFSGPVPRI